MEFCPDSADEFGSSSEESISSASSARAIVEKGRDGIRREEDVAWGELCCLCIDELASSCFKGVEQVVAVVGASRVPALAEVAMLARRELLVRKACNGLAVLMFVGACVVCTSAGLE